jgi:hypothetical protein
MGSQIRLTCSNCDLNSTHSVGVGMMGTGTQLCACYRCKKFVTREIGVRWNDDDTVENVQLVTHCQSCDGELVVINPPWREEVWADDPKDDYFEIIGDPCECPLCGGFLLSESTGMMWD